MSFICYFCVFSDRTNAVNAREYVPIIYVKGFGNSIQV